MNFFRAHPLGFWFIFWGELAERASYYGMRAILALYLVDRLGFSESSASVVVAAFGAAVYLLPLAGGYIADRGLGKYRTIVLFSLPYILGHVILGIESRPFLYLALGLLAMGSGVIKPNLSPLMGLTYQQQRPGQDQLLADAFAMFYFAINVGATASSWVMPLLRTWYGYAIAFLFPAGLMAIAFLLFAAGKPFYAVEPRRQASLTPEERRERWQTLMRLTALFVVVAFFWSIFEQSPSTWTLFAREYLDLQIGSWTLQPDQLQTLNPLLILVLLPALTVFWRVLARWGLPLRETDKMLLGFVLTAITMALMAVAGYRAEISGKVSVYWEVAAYVLITLAEICISVVGLELAFTLAPATMKSFITACWLATIFLGNLLNTQLTRLYKDVLAPGSYFALLTAMLVPATIAFVLIARRFNRNSQKPVAGDSF